MARELRLGVKGSAKMMDLKLYSYLTELKKKEFRNHTEETALEILGSLYDLYSKLLPTTQSDVTSYKISHNGVAIDAVFELDRPSVNNLKSLAVRGNDIQAKFEIRLFDDGSTEQEKTYFINWFIKHHEASFKYIIGKYKGFKLIQAVPEKTYWELDQDKLLLDLTFNIVFR